MICKGGNPNMLSQDLTPESPHGVHTQLRWSTKKY
jgi:hypothetical protein